MKMDDSLSGGCWGDSEEEWEKEGGERERMKKECKNELEQGRGGYGVKKEIKNREGGRKERQM